MEAQENSGQSDVRRKREFSATDLQPRVSERWAARMTSPSAFTSALTSLNNIPSSITSNSENYDNRLKSKPPTVSDGSNTCHATSMHNEEKAGDSSMAAEFLQTSRGNGNWQNGGARPSSFRSDAEQNSELRDGSLAFSDTEKLPSTSNVSGLGLVRDIAPSTAEVQANTGADPRFHCRPKVPTGSTVASSTPPKKEVEPKYVLNSDAFSTTDLQAREREEWAEKTASPAPEGQAESHFDPRFDCRPKVPTSKPNASPTLPKKKTGPTLYKCDENFECEALENQASTIRKWKSCPKNPGHKDFCPVKEFSRKRLPEGYKSLTYEKGIKSVADLTVRIKVKHTSKDRPDDDKFARFRGLAVPHTGSGFIHARLFASSTTNMEFPDNFTGDVEKDGLENHLSAQYDRKNYEERVKYILQEIFPSLTKKEKYERVMTRVMQIPRGLKGFFDCISDHKILRNSEDFDGVFDENDDFNHLYDYKVIQVLLKLDLRDSTHLIQSLPDAFHNSKPGQVAKKICEMKELWFGPLYERKKESKNKCERAYRMLSRIRRREWVINNISDCSNMFREVTSPMSTFPQESDFEFFRYDDLDEKEDINDSKNFQDRDEMKVNAQAKTFSEFQSNLDDDELNEQSSESDKDEDEEQKEEYLNEVFEIVRPCPCQKCTESGNPKPKGYSVNVLTARHVVYDKEEAQKTVVDLFCDDEDETGGEDSKGVKSLSGVDVHVSSSSGDFAILMCATHDEELIRKLQKMIITMTERVENMKANSNTPLAVICSHPHGHFKHITVGEWTTREIYRRRDALPPLWTSYLYNTPTCPGSSGAPVLILGHKSGTLSLDSLLHPHHGHEEETLNRSSRLVSYYRKLEDMSPKARERVKKEQEEVYTKTMKEVESRSRDELKKLRKAAETVEGVKKVFTNIFKLFDEIE